MYLLEISSFHEQLAQNSKFITFDLNFLPKTLAPQMFKLAGVLAKQDWAILFFFSFIQIDMH
jgi:hypothetical protein